MRTIRAYDADSALRSGVLFLADTGLVSKSRNGPVLRAPGPVVTEYMLPRRRVVFDPLRDANPVFHLMESLWMIAGRRDVAPLLEYNSTFDQFAEEDGNQHGAYGYRWRRHFGFDQLESAILQLRASPLSRQVVLQMWSAEDDMGVIKKDRPCNTTIYFDFVHEALNMTVCCRSNDMVLGAYGANVVHMSILHELVAAGAGLPLGIYYQFSNNFHAYTEHEVTNKLLKQRLLHYRGEYEFGEVEPLPLLDGHETWEDFVFDCEDLFTRNSLGHYRTKFVRRAHTLALAYRERKAKLGGWQQRVESLGNWDFAVAFKRWAERRDNGSK